MEDIQKLIGKEVEAVANGIQYYGVLIEVSEDEVYLKTPLQWVVLPANDVSLIKLKGAVDMEPERVGQEEFSPEEIEEIEEIENKEKGK